VATWERLTRSIPGSLGETAALDAAARTRAKTHASTTRADHFIAVFISASLRKQGITPPCLDRVLPAAHERLKPHSRKSGTDDVSDVWASRAPGPRGLGRPHGRGDSMRRLLTLILAGALVPAALGDGAKRPRPGDVPPTGVVTELAPNPFQLFNDYATPERTFSSRRAVIHYVIVGIDAPPQNDDDRDGVPDYVERIGAAADTAISYYEHRGFKPIAPDEGGLDPRPDVYVSRCTPGYLGVALPAVDAQGGAFIVVSTMLDPSTGPSFGSLYGTVAHEVFHLVQFSYLRVDADPALLPSWIVEGSAAAMAQRVNPELLDGATVLQVRGWLGSPAASLETRSYAAQLLWSFLDARYPQLLPSFFTRVGALPSERVVASLLAETVARSTGEPFASVFGAFAVAEFDEFGGRITPFRRVVRGGGFRASVPRLGIDYVRIACGARAPRTIVVTLANPDARASLAYQLEAEIPGGRPTSGAIAPRVSDGGRTFTFTVPPKLLQTERLRVPTLVISNGCVGGGVTYRVSAR